MSGGSFSYMYEKVKEYYPGRMEDDDLDLMMLDLVRLLHDLEWWKSSDYTEDQYRETVDKFKQRWFSHGVVRCKECIHKSSCIRGTWYNDKRYELKFCSRAERREEES